MAEVLREMKSDPDLRHLLEESHGVLVVPNYASAALVIGAAGGDAVLLLRQGGEWTHPAFYHLGSLSAGLQLGIEAGSMAMVLTSDRALDSFTKDNNFSLSADAGFSVIEWSARARGELTATADLILWMDTDGLLGELALGLNNLIWDSGANREYYGRDVDPERVLRQGVASPNAHLLANALAAQDR
ncbi:lipid-binding SYLF domain-containing protein [Gilvimarinus sp. F26214L]|uniref:lipid-binding SYLF domain-containing protein n=1 Tax=Gilvimarinus sp. DZF01 TaxID=3461371 RepID=UPI00404686E8